MVASRPGNIWIYDREDTGTSNTDVTLLASQICNLGSGWSVIDVTDSTDSYHNVLPITIHVKPP
ncbi:Uncharacterized protein FWK35_00011711 [Aphis craccivora]|uniref:Uncharacterized protein n=1 Tax=Aphis craccivora TaxID=307492 RepID=A0A6G0YMD2_APHCR|nr:Uncharacterized protein FWK35_00011711 [Aphis craccivora]